MITQPLKDARIAAGLTALRCAYQAGTTEQRIYQIERRRFRPHEDEALRLSFLLDVPVRNLFPDGTQENPR